MSIFVDTPTRFAGDRPVSNDEIFKRWDGKKVWVLVDEMWRQATIIACCPPQQVGAPWGFVVQSKHESSRNLVFANLIENTSDFDNIEVTDYIDIPNPAQLPKAEFDYLPENSTDLNIGSHKCPVHPYVADYIQRLLNQVQQISPSSQNDALITADSEISRLRILLQATTDRYFAKCREYDSYINDFLAELNTARLHLNSYTGQTVSDNASGSLTTTLTALQTDNRRLIEENFKLRNRNEELISSKVAPLPTSKELEILHKELNRLQEVVRLGIANTSTTTAQTTSAQENADASVTLFQRLEEDNRNLLEAQLTTASNLRLAGLRMNQLSARITKYERYAIEYGRPAFDFESAQDIELMMTKLLTEGSRLVSRLDSLEASLAKKFEGGAPPGPARGTVADAIESFRLTLIYLEARVDHFTGTSDPQSFAFGRIQDLEMDLEHFRELLNKAEQENLDSNNYTVATLQPLLNENTMLKSQLTETMRKYTSLQDTLAKKQKPGLFW